jgi:hypothetical protein
MDQRFLRLALLKHLTPHKTIYENAAKDFATSTSAFSITSSTAITHAKEAQTKKRCWR